MHAFAALVANVAEPRQARVRRLRDRTRHVEMKDGLGCTRPHFGYSTPPGIARASATVAMESVTHELHADVILVRRPVLREVVQKCRPRERQPVFLEVVN